jgi:uncharacterized protein (DUF2252 family)
LTQTTDAGWLAHDQRSEPALPFAHTAPAERLATGKALRRTVPRSSHAGWSAPPDRRDPIDLLQATDRDRQPDLVPLRYDRMLESSFAFLRGSAVVMAQDLAATPATGIQVQACGDAHLANFGSFATPERKLVFDLNDFDETLSGPWEWDVKRLAASIVLAGRTNGFSPAACTEAASAVVRAYRAWMHRFAGMRYLDIWYSQVEAATVVSRLPRVFQASAREQFSRAMARDHLQALARLTTVVQGQVRIADDPPLIEHVSDPRMGDRLQALVQAYLGSLRDDCRRFLQRYTIVDSARKVVGVGSVGTRCYVVLLMGRDLDDPLFLQVKEATASVLESHLGPDPYGNHGQRVVRGQQVIQGASDAFLGWGRVEGLDFYIRQLRDMKGAARLSAMTPAQLRSYGMLCGGVLARAHARSGDAALISGYLGTSAIFDQAVTTFATAYADQVERDHAALVVAARIGRVAITPRKA